MSDMPPDAPVTRREFSMSLTLVWLFIVLIAVPDLERPSRWTDLVLPVGALGILFLHAASLRRTLASGGSRGNSPQGPTG